MDVKSEINDYYYYYYYYYLQISTTIICTVFLLILGTIYASLADTGFIYCL